jgi:hypothetical protein
MAKKITKAQLMKTAKSFKIRGRSQMNMAQLERAIIKAQEQRMMRRDPDEATDRRQIQKSETNTDRDRLRKAKPPGRRVSKSGRVYYERRANRSDVNSRRMMGGRPINRRSMADKTYNGWKNFETWWINLHFFDGVTADDLGIMDWEGVHDYVEEFVYGQGAPEIIESMAWHFAQECDWQEIYEAISE